MKNVLFAFLITIGICAGLLIIPLLIAALFPVLVFGAIGGFVWLCLKSSDEPDK